MQLNLYDGYFPVLDEIKNFCHAEANSWRLNLATGALNLCPKSTARLMRNFATDLKHWYKPTMKIALRGKFMTANKKPSVLLLGDSISLGYRDFVKADLAGVMDVYFPPENGRFAAYTFRALYEWSRDLKFPADMDFVYWNNGLWDVVRIFGDEPQTPLKEYESVIWRTYARLRHLFPKAQIIFATTTPVVEELYNENFYRRNEDIKCYNAAATQVVLECGGIVHDLYSGGWQRQAYQDATHFNLPARKFIADAVVKLLKKLAD